MCVAQYVLSFLDESIKTIYRIHNFNSNKNIRDMNACFCSSIDIDCTSWTKKNWEMCISQQRRQCKQRTRLKNLTNQCFKWTTFKIWMPRNWRIELRHKNDLNISMFWISFDPHPYNISTKNERFSAYVPVSSHTLLLSTLWAIATWFIEPLSNPEIKSLVVFVALSCIAWDMSNRISDFN